METKLLHGDCYELIPTLPDKSIDLVITDPPFSLDIKYGGGGLYKKGQKRVDTLNELRKLNCCEFFPSEFLDLLLPKMKDFYGYFFCNKTLVDEYIVWAKHHNFKFDLLIMIKLNAGAAFNLITLTILNT